MTAAAHACIAQCRAEADQHFAAAFDGQRWQFDLLGAGRDAQLSARRKTLNEQRALLAEPSSDAAPRAEPSADAALLVSLADVQAEAVRWLWPGRVPLGKVAILDGDPGLGKSVLTLDLAARVSTGRAMPDAAASDLDGAAGVVLLSAEDDLADTIRPRLDAAGADVSRIVALRAVMRIEASAARAPTARADLPTVADLDAIRDAIKRVDAKLAIVDPLMAYLPSATNSFRDQDVRRALAPLAALAAETGAAIVVVRHLNKAAGGNPLYRGGGSIGIIGAARSGLLVARDPDDQDGPRRILASTKCNLAEPPAALAFQLEAAANGAVRVVWLGETEHTAAALLAVPADGEERGALDEAKDFLRELLADSAAESKDVLHQAREAGIPEKTLRRAKTAIGVVATKRGMAAGWQWSLPGPKMANNAEDGHIQDNGYLRESWPSSAPDARDQAASVELRELTL